MDEQDLIDAALDVRQRAYCRYSNYSVGSALLDDTGEMHVGCNVENAAYPEGTCAEANAIAAMIASGKFTNQIVSVVGSFVQGSTAPDGSVPFRFADQGTVYMAVDQGALPNIEYSQNPIFEVVGQVLGDVAICLVAE